MSVEKWDVLIPPPGLGGLPQPSRISPKDTLYALRELDREFAVLEVLGLTGDVAIMIQELSRGLRGASARSNGHGPHGPVGGPTQQHGLHCTWAKAFRNACS